MGSEIYPEIHENPKAFFSSSSPILLESSIQYPWGVGLHQDIMNELGHGYVMHDEHIYQLTQDARKIIFSYP